MDEIDNKEPQPEDRPAPSVILNWIKLAAAVVGIALTALWLISLYPSFMRQRAIIKELEPQLKAAKKLNLDYDTALAAPEKYRDKDVLWCVQTGQEGAAFYKGDLSRRLFVKNHPAMPAVNSSKHSNCADMLLKVESAQKLGSTGVVTVRFIHKFE